MIYATSSSTTIKVPRHTDGTIATISLVNQFTRVTSSISVSAGDFTVDYTESFYYEVKLNAELPITKGSFTYYLKDSSDQVLETGTLQYDF